MANKVQGNVALIDTTADDIVTGVLNITGVFITPSSANGYVDMLHDTSGNSGVPVVRFGGATAADTKYIDLSGKPLTLSKGLQATVSNCQVTVVFDKIGVGT